MPNSAQMPIGGDAFHDFRLSALEPVANLPDPENTIRRLALCVLEIISGVRDVEQIIRWTTPTVYAHIQQRANLSQRARAAKKQAVVHPHYVISSYRWNQVGEGIVEASVIVKSPHRARAISMRLEGITGIWKASAFTVL